MANFQVNDNGTWREVKECYVNVDNQWKKVQETYVNNNGTWVRVLGAPPVNTPSITSPTDGQILSNRTPTVTASGFSAPGPPQSHVSSSWQISSSPYFTTVVYEITQSTSQLTSFTVPSDTLLNQTYYVRVKYFGTLSESAWSPGVSFTTPVIAPKIEFTRNFPATLSGVAGSFGYFFEVQVRDSANVGLEYDATYKWYFNNIFISAFDSDRSSWYIGDWYWSDTGKTIYCTVTYTIRGSGLSSTANTQVCTAQITRSTDKDVPDVTQQQMTNQFRPYNGGFQTNDNTDWGVMSGIKMFDIPTGQGKARFYTSSNGPNPERKGTFVGMRKSNFPSGFNCSNGRGTRVQLGIRVALYNVTKGTVQTWDDQERTIECVQSDATDNWDTNVGDWNWEHQEDLDPTCSYQLWLQSRRGDVDKCYCPNYDNCQNIGPVGSFYIKINEYISLGYVPMQYRNDTRPTPIPPTVIAG